MRSRSLALIALLLCLVLASTFAAGTVSAAQETPSQAVADTKSLDDFQKETIAGIREITLQLILIAAGVAAIVGGFVSGEQKKFVSRQQLGRSFVFLSVSISAGLLGYGRLINLLTYDAFDAYGWISLFAMVQWVSFAVGGMLFMRFVYLNIKG